MNKIRRVVIFFLVVIACKSLFAQSAVPEPAQEPTATYRLFKTPSDFILIKLNTITGQMWQVEYDFRGINSGSTVLNPQDLAKGKEHVSGRFTIYPAYSYAFILLDQIDGSIWQVYWPGPSEAKKRSMLPIPDKLGE